MRTLHLVLIGLALATGGVNVYAAVDPAQPPGKLYSVGTHRLHLFCKGHGQPAVIFESGLGGIGLEWMEVLDRVATQARACYYDRAGYGWSEPGPLPRTAAREATELLHLIEVAPLRGPVVLVAHSFGGYVAQIFARRHPERIAGLVLVDSSHPAQVRQFPIKRATYCDLLAAGYPLSMSLRPHLPVGFPAPYRELALTMMLSVDAARAQLSELCNFDVSASEAATPATKFPPRSR